MKYQALKEGFIFRCQPDDTHQAAVTVRCAVTRRGRVLSTFMTQTRLSCNDVLPMIAVSDDAGETWQTRGPIWPHLREKWSIECSISKAPNGDLYLFGSRTPRSGKAGESFWCEETLGILQNELIWSRSTDDGDTWLDPQVFKIPLPGSAECPAPICVTRSGQWLAPYAPHNTFDPNLKVDLKHVVLMISDDQGGTWRHTSMIRVYEQDSYVAESWVTQLSTGVLLGTAWHLHRGPGDDHPNAFALSYDDGNTWRPTQRTNIMGQSAALAPIADGKVLFVYNQRLHGAPGVWLAVARPGEDDFGLLHNDVAWRASIATRNASSGKSMDWPDFAFGEPSVTIMPDGAALVAMWCIQPDGAGARFVKLRIS